MKLHQVLQIINEEESSSKQIANQIIKIVNDAINFGSISNIDIALKNELKYIEDNFYPDGSVDKLNLKNTKKINEFIEQIIDGVKEIKSSKPKFYEMVLKKVENFKQELLKFSTNHQ